MAQGITDETMAYHASGMSMSDAIAMTVMKEVKGLSPEIGSLRMNRYSTDDVKGQHSQPLSQQLDGLLVKMQQMYNPLQDQERKQQESLDPLKLLKAPKDSQYEYQAYKGHDKEKFRPDQKESIYRDEKGAARGDIKPDLYGSLELMLYSQAVDRHIRESLEESAEPARSYVISDSKYMVAASQGYITDLGLGYLVLNLFEEGKLKQSYTVMAKEDKENHVQDERMMEELVSLMEKIREKDDISEEDALESIKKLAAEKGDEEKERISRLIDKIKNNKKGIKDLKLLIDKDRELAVEISKSDKSKKYGISYHFSGNDDYVKQLERRKKDFTNLVPHKTVSKAPKSIMGGILGYTYLGENFMVIRDDLNGYEANEVEIHEAIHTPDEYETRILTKWMLDDETHYH